MWSVFEASLSSESDSDDEKVDEHRDENWAREPKVKVHKSDEWIDEGDLGDSCCFGTRTVEVGLDCVWKLHGGV